MKTIKELNFDILKISTTINEMFPELTKYIEEMPLRLLEPYAHGKDVDNLQDYYDTLGNLLTKYSTDHIPIGEDVLYFQNKQEMQHHQYGLK